MLVSVWRRFQGGGDTRSLWHGRTWTHDLPVRGVQARVHFGLVNELPVSSARPWDTKAHRTPPPFPVWWGWCVNNWESQLFIRGSLKVLWAPRGEAVPQRLQRRGVCAELVTEVEGIVTCTGGALTAVPWTGGYLVPWRLCRVPSL